jgi:hypothetical protein
MLYGSDLRRVVYVLCGDKEGDRAYEPCRRFRLPCFRIGADVERMDLHEVRNLRDTDELPVRLDGPILVGEPAGRAVVVDLASDRAKRPTARKVLDHLADMNVATTRVVYELLADGCVDPRGVLAAGFLTTVVDELARDPASSSDAADWTPTFANIELADAMSWAQPDFMKTMDKLTDSLGHAPTIEDVLDFLGCTKVAREIGAQFMGSGDLTFVKQQLTRDLKEGGTLRMCVVHGPNEGDGDDDHDQHHFAMAWWMRPATTAP